MKQWILSIKQWLLRHEYWRVFLTLFGLVFLCFAARSLPNGLTLPMNGDYILQQLHFYVEGYDSFWNFIRTGEFQMWSYEGFLGVNYFAANTFYYLTSPFLLPMLFVPRVLLPQMIFIMMLVKLTVGGLLFYILLRKYFQVSEKASMIGAIAYALCGWGMYYLWFNHFSDVLAVFPLTLIGVEHLLQKRKGWLLSIGLFIMGITNYYFLFAFVFTTFGYAIFRYIQLYKTNKGHNTSILGFGAIHFILGIGMCAVVLLPAINVVLSTPRFEDSSLIFQLLRFFFENPTRIEGSIVLGPLKSLTTFFDPINMKLLREFLFIFTPRNVGSMVITPAETALYPIAQFLFPPVSNWTSLVFSEAPAFDNAITSIFVSTPLSLLLWPAAFQMIRKKKWWLLFGFLVVLVLPFIPVTYYLLNAFTMVYGRWQLFLVAMILIVTIPLLDHYEEVTKLDLDISFLITMLLAMIVVWYSGSIDRIYGTEALLGIAAQLLVIMIFYYLLREYFTPSNIHENLRFLITLELIIAANITMLGQGVSNYWTLYGGQNLLQEQQQIVNDIKEEDPSFYRIFNTLANRNYNNLAMTLGYKGISSFHSVYSFQLNDFINEWSKVSYSYYNWSMGVHEKRYNLDSFLNVKYYILENDDQNVPLGTSIFQIYDHYTVYRNDYHVELGYAMDDIISESSFMSQLSYPNFSKESYYSQYAVIPTDSFAEIASELGKSAVNPSLTSTFSLVSSTQSKMQLYFLERGTNEPISISGLSSISNLLEDERNNTLYGPWLDRGWIGDKIIAQLSSNNLICPDAASLGGCHVITRFNYGPNVNIQMYSGNTLVTQDDHGINYYDKGGDHKSARGFYVTSPVDRIEIEILNDAPLSQITKDGLVFYYEPFSLYQERQNERIEDAFFDVEHTNNTLGFSTDYEQKKMIVLSVPYDKGWSLTINGEPATIHIVDSGFIGIVSQVGEARYELSYQTPGIMTGVKISFVSWIIFGFLSLIVSYPQIQAYSKRFKKKYKSFILKRRQFHHNKG